MNFWRFFVQIDTGTGHIIFWRGVLWACRAYLNGEVATPWKMKNHTCFFIFRWLNALTSSTQSRCSNWIKWWHKDFGMINWILTSILFNEWWQYMAWLHQHPKMTSSTSFPNNSMCFLPWRAGESSNCPSAAHRQAAKAKHTSGSWRADAWNILRSLYGYIPSGYLLHSHGIDGP